MLWSNHVAVAAPRNGTSSHSVSPTSGVTVAGSSFTPTAGSLLVVIAYCSATITTPSGYTLKTSAVNTGALYDWSKTAAGGSGDDFTVTLSASDRCALYEFFEFPAGSTYVGDVTATGVADIDANPNLTGMTGLNVAIGVKAKIDFEAADPITGVWTAPTVELVDTNVDVGTSDGYWFSTGYIDDYASAAYQPTCTRTGGSGNGECITFAVKVGSAAPVVSPLRLSGPSYAAHRAASI